MAARLHGCKAARLHGCKAARLQSCKAARLSELILLQIAAPLVQMSCIAAAAAAEMPELHSCFCHGCIADPPVAALPLPLQLKSWKGCNAELMAQTTSRVSSMESVSNAGTEVWDCSLQLGKSCARSPSFIAAAPSEISRGRHAMRSA